MRRFIPVTICLLAGVCLHAACSATDTTRTNQTGGTTGQGGEGGGVDFGDGGLCSGVHCSADLHSLVDCSGNVVMTCPGDQGCSGNTCVPACTSASDNKSTFGCDYYVVGPDISFDGRGGCFAAFVVNTWTTPVGVNVEFEGAPLDVSKFAYIPTGSGNSISYNPLTNGEIPPGEVAILFLNRFGANPLGLNTNCPPGITPAITSKDTAPHGTTFGSAFHIATSAPVVAYDIYPYGGGRSALTSATLLLPTSAWDTNYIAVDAYGTGFGPISPFIAIAAREDGTSVTIKPFANIVGNATIPGTMKGVPATYTINRGQVLQFVQGAPLAGSAEAAAVGARQIHRPAGELRVVEPVGQVVAQEAPVEVRLGRDRELAAAGSKRRRKAQRPRDLPHELLQEADKARIIEPAQRNLLQAE